MRSRVYVTVGRPSVCLSVCTIRRPHAAAEDLRCLRTGKVRQSETDVLPLCHATNLGVSRVVYKILNTVVAYGRIGVSVTTTKLLYVELS